MGLILNHPEVAFRSCEVCKRYLFDEKTGEMERNSVTNEPLERPKGTLPPCGYGPKECPKVSPDAGLELTDQNLLAYQHYRECRAVGRFPDDSIVRENAAAIREVEDQIGELREQRFLLNILTAGRGF